MMGLLELLRDDFGRGLRIQEAVTDDLADDLVGATVVGLGAGGFAVEGQSAVGLVEVEQLEVAGLGVTELGGGVGGTGTFALAFEEHRQLEGDLIVEGDQERTGRAGEVRLLLVIENDHGGRYSGRRERVQLNMALKSAN
jgi:hypothetical protein